MRIGDALAARSPSRPRQIPLELPTFSGPGRFGHDGDTRLINCYAEQVGKGGKIQFPIYSIVGLTLFSTLTNGGACRGMLSLDSHLHVVSGRLLFAVDTNGAATAVGGIPDDGPVIMSRNRASPTQTVITTLGGLKFIVTNRTNMVEITDTDLPPPHSNDFIDGYTLYFLPDGRVFYSAIDNAASIGANDYFEAEGNPDQLVRGYVHKRTIFLLGRTTTELWDSVGDATNPFQRSPGGFLPFGCLAPGSVATLQQFIVFVDNHGTVVMSTAAGETTRISNHAVERAIYDVEDKATIEGFVFHRRGHEYYVLSAANFTWVYDLTLAKEAGHQQAWHERQSYQKNRWRAAYYSDFAGHDIVGDFESGKLYRVDPDAYTENGEHIIAKMRLPIHAWPNPIRLNRLRFDMIPGVGLNTATLHNSDPQLMLRLSKNGGKSYGNEMTRSIGKIGQHTATTVFDKLGTSLEDGFVVEASGSAAVIKAFTGISSEADILRR